MKSKERCSLKGSAVICRDCQDTYAPQNCSAGAPVSTIAMVFAPVIFMAWLFSFLSYRVYHSLSSLLSLRRKRHQIIPQAPERL